YAQCSVRYRDSMRKPWIESRWPEDLGNELPAIIGDSHQTFAVRGERVAQLTLNSDAPTLRALPNLPVALSTAVGTPADAYLYVAGIDASGARQLLQLSPVSETRQWKQL